MRAVMMPRITKGKIMTKSVNMVGFSPWHYRSLVIASRYALVVSNCTPRPRKLVQAICPATLKGSAWLGREKTTVV
jgi:hypothetical protein